MTIQMMTQQTLEKANRVCPTCTPNTLIKYGVSKGGQIYYCKTCGKRFTDNGALPGRRVPPDQVGTAISLFYSGLSISEIARHLADIYEIPPPSKATIYEWATDYTRLAINTMESHKAKVGDKWVADEMVVKIGGENYWNWNVMDVKTRYILASHLSKTRTIRDAQAVFTKAKANSMTIPTEIKTDRLKAYDEGIERVFGGDTKHVKADGIRAEVNNNLSERLQGTFRQRIKVLRGLHSKQTAQLFLDGWVINYNLFRPHGTIEKTPAAAAGITLKVEEWEDFAKRDVSPFTQVRVLKEQRRKPRASTQ